MRIRVYYLFGRKLNTLTSGGRMKRVLVFLIFYSFLWVLWTFLILCPSTQAQWEDAQVQRLTYNTSVNNMLGLCIDKNDKLFLFYLQWWWDPWQQPYRDTLFLMTKEKDGEWSQPQRISNSFQELYCGSSVGYDLHSGLIHLFYECKYGPDEWDNALYYTNSNMPNWETVKTDSGSNRARVGAMAFDTLGNIHLLWNVDFDSVGGNWYRVMYANNSTGEWVKHQVSPPIWLGGMLSGPSYFAVQKNGAVHIVYHGEGYCDWECQAFYVRNDSLNSTNWITDTVPKPSRPLWYYAAGPMKVDDNDRLHLITGGCIAEDCTYAGMIRRFYYHKQTQDSLWQGPEQILDTMLGAIDYDLQLLVDKQGVAYMGMQTTSMEAYFTDRKQGSWQVPYLLVGYHEDPDSLEVDDFCFVLDSQGKGHGAFVALHLRQLYYDDDSLEIYYLSSSGSDVETEEDHKIFHFNLLQNYPNPFNTSTIITYEIEKGENVTLKIYNILGREVRSLVNSRQSLGKYHIVWDGKNNQAKEVSSGIYFYQLRAGDYKETKKLVLIR
jgi:hypothetical protein